MKFLQPVEQGGKKCIGDVEGCQYKEQQVVPGVVLRHHMKTGKQGKNPYSKRHQKEDQQKNEQYGGDELFQLHFPGCGEIADGGFDAEGERLYQ